MYLWAKLPPGLIKDDDDLSFCMRLVARTGVALSPGRGFGPGGFGYVRFALVQPEEVLEAAAALIGETIEEIRRESKCQDSATAESPADSPPRSLSALLKSAKAPLRPEDPRPTS